jgi:hypothetical protein
VDLYGAFGVYGVCDADDITSPPRGYEGLAKVPIDLTFNLGLRADTAAGGFLFGVSNWVGFLPVRGAPQ